jgi:hypothetical protein
MLTLHYWSPSSLQSALRLHSYHQHKMNFVSTEALHLNTAVRWLELNWISLNWQTPTEKCVWCWHTATIHMSLKSRVLKITSCCLHKFFCLRRIGRLVDQKQQLSHCLLLISFNFIMGTFSSLTYLIVPVCHHNAFGMQLRDWLTWAWSSSSWTLYLSTETAAWLPLVSRITFKLCLLMHLIHSCYGQKPPYLTECESTVAAVSHKHDQ